MKVVVIGGRGHIGTYLVPLLIHAGFETVSITRGNSKPYIDDSAWHYVENVIMDRTKKPGFAEKIAAMRPDAVIDLVSFDISEVRAMAAALADTQCGHYLFCSSCWAHGPAEVLPLQPDDPRKKPICDYGHNKFATELYLKELWRTQGFPATIIMPGQISGPGWHITGPWANIRLEPFQMIANGEKVLLPNFGMETLHHVHAYDVAQMFLLAITHRNQALGETFDAASGGSITLYGYVRLLADFFNTEPMIEFTSWKEWKSYVFDLTGDEYEIEQSRLHMMRSGSYSIVKEQKLLDYQPRYSNVDAIRIAVQSYVDRGLVHTR